MENLSRRNFIKNTSSGLISLAILNPFSKLFATNKKDETPTWNELVDYARWCPTVHNLQPHLIKILSKTEVELYYNPKKLLPIGDPESIFATVAMGIFIENLSIASGFYGKKIEISHVSNAINLNAKSTTLFAKLKMVSSNENESLNRDLILKRKTSRLHYNGKPIAENTIQKLKNETEKFNHEFFSTSNQDTIKSIIEMNQQTLFEDLESEATRNELDTLFRYSKEDAETQKDGLWAKCMGFSGSLMKSVFTNHEKWTKGIRRSLLSNNYKNSFKGTSTICWFGGNFENTTDWLNAGRMFARNWLILTQENAYLQPFGSLITNENAYKKINETFTQPTENKKIWMIFRAGYSNEPTKSFRLSTDEIIIK
jgi:hypothetical protein